MSLQGIAAGARAGHNVTFHMTRSLDPFRFVPIAVSGWMNGQQLELIPCGQNIQMR
jgi:hypothetical protein